MIVQNDPVDFKLIECLGWPMLALDDIDKKTPAPFAWLDEYGQIFCYFPPDVYRPAPVRFIPSANVELAFMVLDIFIKQTGAKFSLSDNGTGHKANLTLDTVKASEKADTRMLAICKAIVRLRTLCKTKLTPSSLDGVSTEE